MINFDELMNLLETAVSSVLDKTKISYSDRRLLAKYIIKTKKYRAHAERALKSGFDDLSHSDFDEFCYVTLEMENDILRIENDILKRLYSKQSLLYENIKQAVELESKLSNLASHLEGEIKGKAVGDKISRVKKAKFAASKRHERTDKAKDEIRKIWASGKYSNRDRCAEEECAALNLSYSTARKALINTPDPIKSS